MTDVGGVALAIGIAFAGHRIGRGLEGVGIAIKLASKDVLGQVVARIVAGDQLRAVMQMEREK